MLRAKAAEIAKALETTHGLEATQVGASPFLDFLMQLLQTLLPMLVTCFPKAKAEDVAAAGKNLNVFQRWHVRRVVRTAIGDGQMQNVLAGPVTAEILKTAENSSVADYQAALDEIG